MKKHILKIECRYLLEILYEGKTFEIRKDDRGYKVGDTIHFVDPDGKEFPGFWRKLLFRITYILRNVPQYGLDKDYCIFAIKRTDEENDDEE